MERPFGSLLVRIVLLVLFGMSATTASPGHAVASQRPCWERVIDDWLDNGAINGTYSAPCYQAALKHVPEDMREYTDIATAISVALQEAKRQGGSSGGARDGVPDTSGGDGHSTANPRVMSRTLQHTPRRTIYRRAVDKLGATSADSLPLPLLVLAGLGTALILAAIALAARKRIRRAADGRSARRARLRRAP